MKVKVWVRAQKYDSSRLEYRRVRVPSLFFDHVSFQYSSCMDRHAQCFGLKKCQLAFTEWHTYGRYKYIIYEKSTVQLVSVGLTQACPNYVAASCGAVTYVSQCHGHHTIYVYCSDYHKPQYVWYCARVGTVSTVIEYGNEYVVSYRQFSLPLHSGPAWWSALAVV